LQLLEDCFLQNPCDKRQIGDGSKVGWHCGVKEVSLKISARNGFKMTKTAVQTGQVEGSEEKGILYPLFCRQRI